MDLKLLGALGLSAALALSFATAQAPPAPKVSQPPTLEERVATLERAVASLSTRFETRAAAVSRGVDTAGSANVAQLESAIMRLTTDLQRVERQADAAQRDASDARRQAQDAERAARDAALRR